MRCRWVVLTSLPVSFSLVYLLAQRNGDIVGFTLFFVGLALILPSTGKLKTKAERLLGTRNVHGLTLAGGLTLALAFSLFTGSVVIPRVDGTVQSRSGGKGASFVLNVPNGEYPGSVAGNTDYIPSCQNGAHVVKPAWSTSYSCNGEPIPSASVAVYFYLLVTFTVCWILVAVILNKFTGSKSRTS